MSLTAEQLEARKAGIGGSDAAAVAGLNPWCTPVDVYLDKIGQAQPVEENDAMYWGSTLEDLVAAEYAKRTGHKIERRNQMIQHKQHPFMLANLDRVIVGQDRGVGILECKTAGAYMKDQWGEPGSDKVPQHYLVQVQHYLAVTGYQWAKMAVLIGGRDFRIYDIPRDEDRIEALIKIEGRFWLQNVTDRIAPPVSNLEDVKSLFPDSVEQEVTASPEIAMAAADLKVIREQLKQLKSMESVTQAEIMEFMGDADTLALEDGTKVATWKSQVTRRVNMKSLQAAGIDLSPFKDESSSRVFRLK